MQLVVGVDAGGSKTRAIAADCERIVATAETSSANLRARGIEAAADEIAAAARGAIGAHRPSALFVGAAGAGDDAVRKALRAAIAQRFERDLIVGVSDDAHIALRAGVETGDALAIIAGTGSIAYGEVAGESHRCGGYGYLVGDEGSGFSIGTAAARLLLRAYEERAPREPWFSRIEAQLDVRDAQMLIDRVYSSAAPTRELAALAPIVLEAAQTGERSATKVVQTAALELFDLIKCLVRKTQTADRAIPLVFAGGLLRENTLLTYLLETRLSNEFPNLEPYKNVPAPEVGALTLARAMVGAPR
jgi:N-acetylglucosamine kinase-like BadF-type ATPase